MPLAIEKLPFAPAYRMVSDDLRRRIVAGELVEDEALPTETVMAGLYGVNRSTLRESLRQLEQEGLLRRDGKRLLVSIPNQMTMARAAERVLRMRQVSYLHVWQVARALEPVCAALAAQSITDAELAALDDNLRRTEQIVRAGESPVDVTIEFQNLVAAATHNQAMVLARGPISLLMRAGYAGIAPALPQSGQRLLDVHRQIVQALRRRDGAAAQALTEKHMRDYRRGCDVAGIDINQAVPMEPMEPPVVGPSES